jgi:hypothetical protein
VSAGVLWAEMVLNSDLLVISCRDAARSEERTRGASSRAQRGCLDQLEPNSSAGCGQSGIARAVVSSCGRRVACILMFRAAAM